MSAMKVAKQLKPKRYVAAVRGLVMIVVIKASACSISGAGSALFLRAISFAAGGLLGAFVAKVTFLEYSFELKVH